MIEINGMQFCENCFETVTGEVCKNCGFNSADNAPDPTMLAPGSVLQNRYIVGRVIGKGGFGITYLAYDALVRRKIAIKEYYPNNIAQRVSGSAEVSVTSADSAEAFKLGAEKFYNEAKLVTRFNGNPNIVGVYDCFYENDTVYIAMEYLRGCTLKEHIRDNGVLSAPKALFAAKNIVNALIVAHSASVLHRDITPDNVILCENGDIKLIDFGAARQVVAEYSQTFSVILKPGFAPPEQYSKKGNQGPWTDVYALGTTLYFMLTGDIPEDPSGRFDDDTFKENIFDVEPALWEIIIKATKLNIDERYPDAYELKKALDKLDIKPEPIIAPSELPESTAESAPAVGSDMTVSIKPIKQKQSFWRKHRRTLIEITCGVLVAAIIIPLAIKAYKPAAAALTSEPSSSDISDSGEPGGNSSPGDPGTVATIGNQPSLKDNGYNNPLFSVLSDTEQELYSNIYNGLARSEKSIVIPSATYKVSEIDDIYDDVLNDNPQFNHTQGYNINYSDINNNKQADPDEYVNSIAPIYTGIDPREANDYITQTLRETDMDDTDKIGYLRFIHDKIISETELIQRNGRPAASTTHGVVIDHAADDLGIAKTICDYAQRLGLESFVLDMHSESAQQALVRVKLDGEWFNINPRYGSVLTNHVTAVPLAEDGKIGHLYFLCNDLFVASSSLGYTIPKASNEKYSPILPVMPESEDGLILNYYYEKYLEINYHWLDGVDGAYAALLEAAKERFDSGEETVELYTDPSLVDELWGMMQESYISDLSAKYGITVSGFSGEYNLDKIVVTLEK